jgi:hypothetical protein
VEKISREEAYRRMDGIDINVLAHERQSIFNSDARQGREMHQQFYLDGDHIVLEVFWDDEVVETMSFQRKEPKNTVGRPSLGTTKKVSLTLPDELWDKIEAQKKKWELNQSQTLRKMIEGYFQMEGNN